MELGGLPNNISNFVEYDELLAVLDVGFGFDSSAWISKRLTVMTQDDRIGWLYEYEIEHVL